MKNRARSLTPYDRRSYLCTDEQCIKSAAFCVEGTMLCAMHAKAEALSILLNEEKKHEDQD